MLEPGDAVAIAQALAAILWPVSVGTLCIAMGWSVLMMLKGSDRAADRFAMKVEKPGTAPYRVFEAFTQKAADKAVAALRADPPKVELPDFKAFEEKADKLIAWANQVTPLINNLTGENLQSIVDGAMNKVKMQKVRDARGAGDQGDADRVQQAAANPEGANMLSFAIRALDAMANNKIIKKATAKDYIEQLKDEFGRTGDITTLANSFGVNLAAFVPGSAPTVTVRGKGGPI